MTRRLSRTCLIAVVLVVALLVAASALTQGTIPGIIWCSHMFPFGIINGGQIARVDVEVTDTVDGSMACPMGLMFPMEVSFFDRAGNMIGDPDIFRLGQGVIGSADLPVALGVPLGRRMEDRATVMISEPMNMTHDACQAEVRLSLQVLDRLTMRTQYAMTEVVMLDLAAFME